MPRPAAPRPTGFRPSRPQPATFGRGTAARFRKRRTFPDGLTPLLIILGLALVGITVAVLG